MDECMLCQKAFIQNEKIKLQVQGYDYHIDCYIIKAVIYGNFQHELAIRTGNQTFSPSEYCLMYHCNLSDASETSDID